MQSAVEFLHVKNRLSIIHLGGIAAFVAFFFLLLLLGTQTDVETLPAQMTILVMAAITALSYLSVIVSSKNISSIPLFAFFLLSAATSILIWQTGVLQSPFIILYIILIIITSQLYDYKYGLLQTVTALLGFVFVYSATTFRLLPFLPLVPDSNAYFLYQPPVIVFVYGMLYAILFTFTVLSSSSARVVLFRPSQKNELDTTYQERIINSMPLPVMVLDADMTPLGSNPAAAAVFPVKTARPSLDKHLSLSKSKLKNLCDDLAASRKTKDMEWKEDTGDVVAFTLSVHLQEGKTKSANTYILFLEPKK